MCIARGDPPIDLLTEKSEGLKSLATSVKDLSHRTLADIREQARRYVAEDVPQPRFTREYNGQENECSGLQPAISNPLAVDKTWEYIVWTDRIRYEEGPQWGSNSCAFDCVLHMAVMMNVGLTRGDQLTLEHLACQEPAKRLIRRWTSRRMGRMKKETQQRLKDRMIAAWVQSMTFSTLDNWKVSKVDPFCCIRLAVRAPQG